MKCHGCFSEFYKCDHYYRQAWFLYYAKLDDVQIFQRVFKQGFFFLSFNNFINKYFVQSSTCVPQNFYILKFGIFKSLMCQVLQNMSVISFFSIFPIWKNSHTFKTQIHHPDQTCSCLD